MKEKPLIFSGPMVRAILSGTKTMTRRVMKLDGFDGGNFYETSDGIMRDVLTLCPYPPGTRIWVRETWAPCIGGAEGPLNPTLYRADNLEGYEKLRWSSPRYMPRWASRITLEIEFVEVERIQDITQEDAIAEGAFALNPHTFERVDRFSINAFRLLWDQLNAKRGYGWDVNPWVWCYTFRMVTPPTQGDVTGEPAFTSTQNP